MSEYQQTAWSLTDLYPSANSPEMEAAFSEVDRKVSEFEKMRPELKRDISTSSFLDAIHLLESISDIAYRLNSYGNLWFASNTQDPAAQNYLARVDQFTSEMSNRTLFFELWWKELGEPDAQRLLEAAGDYRYWLEKMRLFKLHTLTEPEEKIINTKNVTGLNALRNLYDTLTNRYVYHLKVDGEEKELTRGELMVYARSSDPGLRARAYQELYRVYGNDSNILGQIYQTVVRDWRNEQMGMRHFSAPIAARNIENDIPDDVVDTLLEVSQQNAVLFQRYFRLKASWLGMEKLRRYDIYAPVAKSEKKYPFGQAVDSVLDSFNQFEPRFASLAERVFQRNHLDSEVRKGKSSGAFCASVAPELTPWILVSFQGRPADIATLAHELGHAVHSMLASDHSLFTFHATLPLAETASTFGEMMLVDRLLAEEKDENVRRDLLFRQVDDAYATIMRQMFFALFERQAHDMTRQGAAVGDLADAYLENLRKQFGDAVELSDEFRWEWVSIPHIYQVPFYVYAYAFGQLLVLSLYQQYRQDGEAFKPRYVQILSAGGSASPEKILTRAGMDIHSASFWQSGFDVLRGLIEQLEAIPVRE